MFTRRTTRALALAVALTALALATGTAAGAEGGGNSANAHLCQHGGWQDLTTSTGESFANTGDCVSYAARGGALIPKLTPMQQFQVVCEESGGTFDPAVEHGDPDVVLWACDWFPEFPSDVDAIIWQLAGLCVEAGGNPFSANIVLYCSFHPAD